LEHLKQCTNKEEQLALIGKQYPGQQQNEFLMALEGFSDINEQLMSIKKGLNSGFDGVDSSGGIDGVFPIFPEESVIQGLRKLRDRLCELKGQGSLLKLCEFLETVNFLKQADIAVDVANIKEFLAAKITPYFKTSINGFFQASCGNGFFSVVSCLLNKTIITPSENDNFAILLAVAYGHLNIVDLLLKDTRVNIAAGRSRYLLLHLAAPEGHTEIVKRLLEDERVEPEILDNHALKLAASRGHVEIVELLLAHPKVFPDNG